MSPGHNYFNHRPGAPGTFPTHELDAVEAVAGKGLKGDRFFGRSARNSGQVTFFSMEVYDELVPALGLRNATPAAARRNIVIAGVPLRDLMHAEFAIDGIRFAGTGHAAPCRWMDSSFGPGAVNALRGRGGLRAKILVGGILRRGYGTLASPHRLERSEAALAIPDPKLP